MPKNPIKVVEEDPVQKASDLLAANRKPYKFRVVVQIYDEANQSYTGFLPSIKLIVDDQQTALRLPGKLRELLEMK